MAFSVVFPVHLQTPWKRSGLHSSECQLLRMLVEDEAAEEEPEAASSFRRNKSASR